MSSSCDGPLAMVGDYLWGPHMGPLVITGPDRDLRERIVRRCLAVFAAYQWPVSCQEPVRGLVVVRLAGDVAGGPAAGSALLASMGRDACLSEPWNRLVDCAAMVLDCRDQQAVLLPGRAVPDPPTVGGSAAP